MSAPIVVTGAAGFIGRNIIAELNRRGRTDIVAVDRLGSDERWSNLVGLRVADVVDADDYLAEVRSGGAPAAEAVIHLGACSATTERDAGFLLRNNYRYTRTLCEWSLARGARFVYASSAATYGDGAQGYSDDDAVTPTLKPLNMYGYSKHLFDLWALESGALARIAGLKYFNVYGPFEGHKQDMRSVVCKAHARISAGEDVELFRSHHPDFRDGEQQRDFVYVRDAVAVTLWLAERGAPSGLFNCGTGQARSWRDLALALFSALGVLPRIRLVDMPEHLRAKYQCFTQADMAKLRRAGYTAPFTSLEDGVRNYVRTHLGGIPARAAGATA
ncbi:MAG: ADP-glyceromanno-heptose 6-epimerase [Planctomycetes bacterium]|nr:ADP-glyceromanno-heptose 6-epimerase [Planctomycetota bacterium]